MKLIVGLGNVGEKYARNRHNAGFMFVDYLSWVWNNRMEMKWKLDKYMDAELCTVVEGGNEYLFAKTQSFMNRSGNAVKLLMKKYSLSPADLIVAHDDLDVHLGKSKIQIGTGPKVHNGIISIESAIKTANFMRVRIGVDNRNGDRSMPGEAYVLQNFKPEEQEILDKVFVSLASRSELK
jgi:PTH1 family peptidyl-tRNA hydrolase